MSNVISRKRIVKTVGTTLGVFLLTACAQTPKHTNTLMFATNTDWGVKVGTDEKQIPVIRIGYKRQEGAFVPVLANTAVDGDGEMVPCPSATVDKDGTNTEIEISNLEDCKFVGTHDGFSQDSYSTLASFGGKTGAEVNGGSAKANVAIAQYFATGIAAQYLAITGGANVVSAGGNSAAKAAAASDGAAAILAKEKANAVVYAGTINTGRVVAKAMLGDSGDPVDATKRAALAQKIGVRACDDAALASLDQRSVKQFLDEMESQKFQCLVRLSNNVAK